MPLDGSHVRIQEDISGSTVGKHQLVVVVRLVGLSGGPRLMMSSQILDLRPPSQEDHHCPWKGPPPWPLSDRPNRKPSEQYQHMPTTHLNLQTWYEVK